VTGQAACLVGIGAALFMLVSQYGFTDILESG
jgi:uncharacterized membrane protein YhiD involved in acid resistance